MQERNAANFVHERKLHRREQRQEAMAARDLMRGDVGGYIYHEQRAQQIRNQEQFPSQPNQYVVQQYSNQTSYPSQPVYERRIVNQRRYPNGVTTETDCACACSIM